MKFILASRSPQRKEILERLGVPFAIIPPDFDEAGVSEKDPAKRALLLAEGKAHAVSSIHPLEWVIGVDTLVVASDRTLLEKPLDSADVRRMLRLHSGNVSTVHTALCLQRGSEKHSCLSSARVHFKTLREEAIEKWIETGLWQDRSGAFQIEGKGEELVDRLEGERETVIGFPVQNFIELCSNLIEDMPEFLFLRPEILRKT